LNVPILRKLFHELADPGQLETLNLTEILGWTQDVLNRVVRESFFKAFEEHHAVQYFYEPFLKAYDPELRKELGVWYTPPEIVKYMVERVDRVLRDELGVIDGLADPQVVVLDPACGIGAYLVEVLDRIHATLKANGGGAMAPLQVKEAALKRVFGFEILPAPFVIAHVQLGLRLESLAAPLSEKQRASVYLTNGLTGWEPADGPKKQLPFPELEAERSAAARVKREVPILVILGNPPYNAFAGVSPAEEMGLVEPYKKGLVSKWKIKKFNLDDLYVRFFRLAERRIAERPKPSRGIVAFVSNYSWVSEPSFTVLREHLLNSFDKIWIENLHGNRKISEYAPDGRTSETIFAIAGYSPGIQQGVVTSLWVRKGSEHKPTKILFRDDIDEARASDRRAQLLESLVAKKFDESYQRADPQNANRYSFWPSKICRQYYSWPRAIEIALRHFNGPVERRGNSLIVFDTELDKLELLKDYFNSNKSDDDLRELAPKFMKSSGEFDAKKSRETLIAEKVKYDLAKIVRYPFKPFDLRRAYLDASIQPLFSRPSPELLALQKIDDISFFITRDTADKSPEGSPFYFSPIVCDYDSISGHARHFPTRVKDGQKKHKKAASSLQTRLIARTDDRMIANLSPAAHQYLNSLGLADSDSPDNATLIWLHSLAIGNSSAYLLENNDGVRADWPRIPLPDDKDLLLNSSKLGRQIADLLDSEKPVPGVTAGAIRHELRTIANSEREDRQPLTEKDLKLTSGWGHAGQDGVTMPGQGLIKPRNYTADETVAIAAGASALGFSADQAMLQLGERACDVYLNQRAYWKNIPIRVWEYRIGGYQVIKKWLSYREFKILGRGLTPDEVNYVTAIARRIAAILLLGPQLDSNYHSITQSTYLWPRPTATAADTSEVNPLSTSS
jgi:hypothetical protein